MGLLLIVIGLIFMLFVSFYIGLVLMILGLVLFFVPAAPYGYSSWHGRRGPPA